ncbi:bifunctional DNA-formamidopyrimidine glycosylase/DNA-(apurinic or apyrimidinic site) lyase [Bartonella ancashensis]|uniref:Formamidopyrimidine-DNA glycosylase n=1 Tax=Bartonella ancashensis TaxID=1318743 RepID=A0A0M4M5S1_9HYPH|nr:bifunctional DNA-formamidopyrimidine glycosylase/DNA-(apurinic or apyrimidinic site) lyase [Bartonella ancashensis]ALE03454.1 Formamidopyrimidine-DNA glycosylase [Bartonella ancashensis]
MPELPEVETIRRGLDPILVGSKILSVTLGRKNLRFPFPEEFSNRITDEIIVGVGRRAKYLLFYLSHNKTILSHLGMSGSWRAESNFPRKEPSIVQRSVAHDHCTVVIQTENNEIFRLIYNDSRRFGFMVLADSMKLNEHPFLKNLGVEPIGDAFSGAYLQRTFVNKKVSLKTALLDQSVIAGLGNIYVCEALWRSCLSPQRSVSTLALKDANVCHVVEDLAQNIREVLFDAILSGGSSLRDYIHADGSLGYFQQYFSVYKREGKECLRCGTLIVRIVQSGRSSFYCPQCQK